MGDFSHDLDIVPRLACSLWLPHSATLPGTLVLGAVLGSFGAYGCSEGSGVRQGFEVLRLFLAPSFPCPPLGPASARRSRASAALRGLRIVVHFPELLCIRMGVGQQDAWLGGVRIPPLGGGKLGVFFFRVMLILFFSWRSGRV